MEFLERELLPLDVAIEPQQPLDLPLAERVADLLTWPGRCPRGFAKSGLAVHHTFAHQVVDRLLEAPHAGRQTDVDGLIDDPGFPYATAGMTLCATNGVRKRVLTDQVNTNFDGVDVTMDLGSTGSTGVDPQLCP